MKKVEPMLVGQMLDEFFKQRRQLQSGLMQGRAVEVWAEVVGEYVSRYTEDVYIRSGVLYATFSSAGVRAEVHIRRRYYVEQINEKLGTKVVKNIVTK